MAKWYGTRTYGNTIEEVEVTRDTAESIFLAPTRPGGKERRVAKVSSYALYFATRDEARAYLVDRIESRVDMLTRELENLKATLAKGL